MLPEKKGGGKKSSFVNKLSGEALQLALLTLCIQTVNTSLLLPNSEVHLKIARLNRIFISITAGKLICCFDFATVQVLIFPA